MKLTIFKYSAAAVILAGVMVPVSAEDLDAVLEAQKKKAQRQIYSESALLEDQNLTVPRTKTEEELLIDRKLREIEARENATVSSEIRPDAFIPVRTSVQPVENRNWLTPAIMDDAASMSLTNSAEDAWLARELERQKEVKNQEAARKENELTEKLLREQSPGQSPLQEIDRLKKYQITKPAFDSSGKSVSAEPAYMSPLTGKTGPATVRPMKKEPPSVPPLFSPEAARISPTANRPSNSPLISPNLGAAPNPSLPGFSTERNDPEPVQLTPLQMIKKSSPINQQNPFADDHMPQIKSSIWE